LEKMCCGEGRLEAAMRGSEDRMVVVRRMVGVLVAAATRLMVCEEL
jgi:hypothetical protein